MKKILLAIFLLGTVLGVGAQNRSRAPKDGKRHTAQTSNRVPFPGGKTYIFRVQLKDKKGTEYNLKHPEKFLSERSLQRRERQGLGVDSTDLPVSTRYLKQLARQGFSVVGGSKWNNTVLVKSSSESVKGELEQLPFVTAVRKVFTSPDSITPPFRFPLVPDTMKYKGTDTTYGFTHKQIALFNGQKLHAEGYRGKGMLIAILDGGFMNADKMDAFKGVDIVGKRDFAYPYTSDICSELDHGTMVLSCMAGRSEGRFLGDAPEASFLLLRTEMGYVETLMEEDNWAMAAEYADSVGVDIINSSLGYNRYDDKSTTYRYWELDGKTALVSRTASMLARKGIVLVNSAGNEGTSQWKKVGVPADASDILAVGALRADSTNTTFSSLGPSADGRVKPDVVAMGERVMVYSGRGDIRPANGTSFASPLTCGMVACLWQKFRNKTALEIMDMVRRSGNNSAHPDNVYGYGIPDFGNAN